MKDLIRGDIFTRSPPTQTLRAWEPFWDCASILFHFQNSDVADEGEELTEWRIFWVAGITLLRTIGHVLAKVDSKTSKVHALKIRSFWEEIKADRVSSAIFWEFVEKERNSLIKTYSFGAELSHDDHGHFIRFADGQDAFQLFREAVYWWRYQLELLEQTLLGTQENLL